MSDCRLCDALDNESPVDVANGFAILRANKLKGHKQRLMIVSITHRQEVELEEIRYAVMVLFEYLLRKRAGDDSWAIMAPTHASIPEHFHLMATTLEDEDAEDSDQIIDTERIVVRFLPQGEQ